MTAVPASARHAQRPAAARGLARVWRHVRPTYDAAIGDGIREGRLTTHGLHPAVRQLAIAGLVAVAALLVSLLFVDSWRQSDLLAVGAEDEPRFLPSALFPVALVAMALGWVLLLVGAAVSSARVQVVVALVFLVVNGSIGRPLVLTLQERPGLEVGGWLVRGAYYGAPLLLLLAAASSPWERARRVVSRVALVGAPALAVVMHGGLIWMQKVAVDVGQPADLPAQVSGAVLQITAFVLPLVFLAQLALVELSYSVSTAAVSTAAAAPGGVVRALFVVVVGGKLAWQLVAHREQWLSLVADRPYAVVRTVVMLLAFAAFAAATRRLYRDPDATPTEGLVYGASLLLAAPLIVTDVIHTVGAVVAVHTGALGVQEAVDRLPVGQIAEHGDLALAAAALAGALAVVLRSSSARARGVAAGVALVAAWAVSGLVLDLVTPDPGVGFAFADLLVTAAVLVYAAARWTRLTSGGLSRLAALAVFVWLVSTKGDLLVLVGTWLSLPDVLLVVVGVVFTLLADSAFTRRGTPRLPRSARVLMWVGYLVLNLALLNWVQATRAFDLHSTAPRLAVFYVALPLAAWLVAVRRFRLDADER